MPTQEKSKSKNDLSEEKEDLKKETKTKKSTKNTKTSSGTKTSKSDSSKTTTPKSTTKKTSTKATTKKATTPKTKSKSLDDDISELQKGITDKKTTNDSKKTSSRKTSRVEKELKRNLEEKKEVKKSKIEKIEEIEEKPNLDRLMDKFATQRVSSIKDELEKSSIRKLEAEMINTHIEMKESTKKTEEYKLTDDINSDEEEYDDEYEEDDEENKKPKKKLFFKILRVFLILGILGIAVLAFLLYGPWNGFRDWYISTAMTTMNHQWLATMFYSQETIDEVLSRNKISEVDDITDNSLIGKPKEIQNNKYANEYEKAVLEKDPEHEDYKIIDIEGKGYNGYLAVVYDASKIHTMITSKLNVAGEYVTAMAKKQGAVLAINGGGFDDPNYSSNGGSPTGITFSRGKLITNRNNTGSVGGIIGFTNDNVLTIGKMSASKAQELGMRDAVTCGPFLIINGKSSEVLGNGGWGDAARTVIGQRQDGIVLMLVLNGRNYATGIIGADMDDLIEIMQRYGAYNAACLDGGTSSVIVENGEILNDPIDGRGRHQTRLIPTAFGVFLNE